jgi:hypothetical protein
VEFFASHLRANDTLVGVQFAEWHKQRRRLFRSLQQKFPAVATLPGGDGGWLLSLAIEGGGSALFSWRLNVDREGAVTSTLDLSPFNFVPCKQKKGWCCC